MNTHSNTMSGSRRLAGIAPAALSATRPLYWSVRRELWENRSIYVVPLAAAGVYLFGFLISLFWLPRSMRALSRSTRRSAHRSSPCHTATLQC